MGKFFFGGGGGMHTVGIQMVPLLGWDGELSFVRCGGKQRGRFSFFLPNKNCFIIFAIIIKTIIIDIIIDRILIIRVLWQKKCKSDCLIRGSGRR